MNFVLKITTWLLHVAYYPSYFDLFRYILNFLSMIQENINEIDFAILRHI